MDNIVQEISNWSPTIIVSLIKEIAWPITVLILGWKFKSNITESISKFFSRNEVTEFSASATGVTAKFKASLQSAKAKEITHETNGRLPDGQDYESILKIHDESTTPYSNKSALF